ncbi:hypothetical protein NIES3585_47030 [Nodularia sp. NIES-3585]|nr:hypothetical protein NIES3585_47030 [Nodularia sp. NIES-3585]
MSVFLGICRYTEHQVLCKLFNLLVGLLTRGGWKNEGLAGLLFSVVRFGRTV